MLEIGKTCHELRINDENSIWIIIYKIYSDAKIILEVFNKKTQQAPKNVIDICKKESKSMKRMSKKRL